MDPERETLARGLSRAAWGYFFLHVNLTLGGPDFRLDLLPAFAGYLLLLSAVGTLSGRVRDLALLRPLCVLLAAWNAADWLFSWRGTGLDGRFPALDLILAAAGLYFHFQFLTDMALLAREFQGPGEDLDRRLLRRRTVYVVLDTALLLAGSLLEVRGWLPVTLVCAVAGLAAAVLVISGLFALRRRIRDGAPGE